MYRKTPLWSPWSNCRILQKIFYKGPIMRSKIAKKVGFGSWTMGSITGFYGRLSYKLTFNKQTKNFISNVLYLNISVKRLLWWYLLINHYIIINTLLKNNNRYWMDCIVFGRCGFDRGYSSCFDWWSMRKNKPRYPKALGWLQRYWPYTFQGVSWSF